MTRSRSALVAAVAALALLAGCSGGDASQSEVQDKVEELLTEAGGFLQEGELTELTATEIGAVSACVSQGLFDPQEFSKDERNEVSSAVDSELPPGGLVDKFTDLVDGCVTEATEGEPQGPSVDDGDEDQTSSDDDETTTTSADDDETTTTTD